MCTLEVYTRQRIVPHFFQNMFNLSRITMAITKITKVNPMKPNNPNLLSMLGGSELNPDWVLEVVQPLFPCTGMFGESSNHVTPGCSRTSCLKSDFGSW